jgi:hypothetical protein
LLVETGDQQAGCMELKSGVTYKELLFFWNHERTLFNTPIYDGRGGNVMKELIVF